MKSVVFAVACALLAWAGSAQAQDAKQDFTLVNKTGYEISAVYVSPSKSDDWEEDVLGQDTLDDGEKANIHFHRSVKTCKWDLKVVYEEDSSSAVWPGIDLCSVETITIRYNKKSDTTTATFD
ncbi:MAG TPA: hypothetical protein VGH49_06470 [Xanthobacteraceae bacterium]